MSKTSKTVAIFTAPQGHKSIAEAAIQAIPNSYKPVFYFDQEDFLPIYKIVYKYIPQIWSAPFHLSNKVFMRHQKINNLVHKYFKLRTLDQIKHVHRQHQPAVCINTHLMYAASLEELQEKERKPLINIITDPRSIHRLLISDKALVNLVFDKEAKRRILTMSPKARVLVVGWFVRQQFEANYNQHLVRKKIKLKNKLTILIVSGSDGTNLVLKLMPSLPLAKTPVQIIIATGNNQNLFRLVSKLGQLIKLYNQKVEVIPLSFTKDIHLYMQAADLVVGKAGPNTLFESVATLTPFFAITHIPGQETGNLEIIRQYRLGYVEENLIRASRLLLKIINQPEQLKKFKPHLVQVAKHNQAAKPRLRQLIKQLT